MAGVDDKIAFFGDWASPGPSPRTFLAGFIGSNLLPGNGSEAPPVEAEERSDDSMAKDGDFAFALMEPSLDRSSDFSPPKLRSGGGLSERVATKAGFHALKINTSRSETVNLCSNGDAPSPFVTIPPGLSPTTLLDSPVFLFNNLVQPSPTTGKFLTSTSPTPVTSVITQGDKLSTCVYTSRESLPFNPHTETSNNNKTVSTVNQTHLIVREVSSQPDYTSQSGSSLSSGGDPQKQQTFTTESSEGKGPFGDPQLNQRAPDPSMGNDSHHSEELDDKEPKGDSVAASIDQQSDDGYNWRKYGQKQVKGSEHPRSYYKCTHPNCEVKKKVERSPEGRVVEIIYKGKHAHSKPPPNRRTTPMPLNVFGENQISGSGAFDPHLGTETKPIWGTPQNEVVSFNQRNDGMDASPSVASAAELYNPSINAHEDPQLEPADVLSTMSNEVDEQATHQSIGISADGDNDESDSKRRKLDNPMVDASAVSRAANREPRVVVQTTSEVDILDDGYRWRKYGQKVVKGNPNPRSYYKCTSPGCPVRKHVERASHDLKSVITTYEGKHNHGVPAARNSGQSNSNSLGVGTPSISQPHSINKRPEPTHMNDGYPQFAMPSNVTSFGMHRIEQPTPPSGFSIGLGQTGLSTLSMGGYGPALQVQAMLPLHSYFGPCSGSDAQMVSPEEPKEVVAASGLQISNNSSISQRFVGDLTFGTSNVNNGG